MKIGYLQLARATLDVGFAREKLTGMLAMLGQTGHQLVGPHDLLFDADTTRAAIAQLQASDIDHLMVLQVTFSDASMAVAAAAAVAQPMSIWAVPEPRLGGRLRLNAFCGLNHASHALGLNGQAFSWLYGDPEKVALDDIEGLPSGARRGAPPRAVSAEKHRSERGQQVADALKGRCVARIGEHPVGFDTCAYSAQKLRDLAGVSVDELDLDDLFDAARTAPDVRAAQVRKQADATLQGLSEVDQDQLERSLRLKAGLDIIRAPGKYDAFTIRCWPETFTEYGGALTQLILQEASGSPVFLTDLVDMDVGDGSGVVWHCGQAPVSMRNPDVTATATATIHTSRKMPLLYEFPLKPGTVTLLRISQSFHEPKMVLGCGEILASALEHHMALAYGDHRATLRAVAAALHLPLLEI